MSWAFSAHRIAGICACTTARLLASQSPLVSVLSAMTSLRPSPRCHQHPQSSGIDPCDWAHTGKPGSGSDPADWPQDASPIPLSHLRSEEHTSELQSHSDLVCRLLL